MAKKPALIKTYATYDDKTSFVWKKEPTEYTYQACVLGRAGIDVDVFGISETLNELFNGDNEMAAIMKQSIKNLDCCTGTQQDIENVTQLGLALGVTVKLV